MADETTRVPSANIAEIMDADIDLYFSLLNYSLWGTQPKDYATSLSHPQYNSLAKIAEEQATLGLISNALIDLSIRLEEDDVFDVIATVNTVENFNVQADKALVRFCQMMKDKRFRILVLKGQTLSLFYRTPRLRQCGDIDFICHPDDMEGALRYLKYDLGLVLDDEGSNKHAWFMMDGIKYEIHRMLTNFAYPPSHYYWENVFMKEVWDHPYTVNVCGYPVPTLAPTYNALYIFEHIFFHLIMDGIGIRQFCDWAVFLHHQRSVIDRELLTRHLKGVRQEEAYIKVGTFLVDKLGLPEEEFPLPIENGKQSYSDSLLQNILQLGNFGHKVRYYSTAHGPIHAIEHLARICRQGWHFVSYAPAEVLWRVPYMIKWWVTRIFRKVIPCKSMQSVFNRV